MLGAEEAMAIPAAAAGGLLGALAGLPGAAFGRHCGRAKGASVVLSEWALGRVGGSEGRGLAIWKGRAKDAQKRGGKIAEGWWCEQKFGSFLLANNQKVSVSLWLFSRLGFYEQKGVGRGQVKDERRLGTAISSQSEGGRPL